MKILISAAGLLTVLLVSADALPLGSLIGWSAGPVSTEIHPPAPSTACAIGPYEAVLHRTSLAEPVFVPGFDGVSIAVINVGTFLRSLCEPRARVTAYPLAHAPLE